MFHSLIRAFTKINDKTSASRGVPIPSILNGIGIDSIRISTSLANTIVSTQAKSADFKRLTP